MFFFWGVYAFLLYNSVTLWCFNSANFSSRWKICSNFMHFQKLHILTPMRRTRGGGESGTTGEQKIFKDMLQFSKKKNLSEIGAPVSLDQRIATWYYTTEQRKRFMIFSIPTEERWVMLKATLSTFTNLFLCLAEKYWWLFSLFNETLLNTLSPAARFTVRFEGHKREKTAKNFLVANSTSHVLRPLQSPTQLRTRREWLDIFPAGD